MHTDPPTASRTAVQVCQGRAAAHGRLAVGRFADPTALALLSDDERRPVDQARRDEAPTGFGERLLYERARATAEVMVPRTVVVDDALRDGPLDQVVILGAGLDGRAWRMPELAAATVFEVDHPASQADKRSRAAALGPPPDDVRFVAVDLARAPLGPALAEAGHDVDRTTTWVWEGVVPYLTAPTVEATTGAVARCSSPGSRLVVAYQAPSPRARVGRLVGSLLARLGRVEDPLSAEPWRSTWSPPALAALLHRHGFEAVDDHDLATVADDLGVDVHHRRSLANGHVTVAHWAP